MVGRLFSFWDGNFSGAMLNFRWAYHLVNFVIVKADKVLLFLTTSHAPPEPEHLYFIHVLFSKSFETSKLSPDPLEEPRKKTINSECPISLYWLVKKGTPIWAANISLSNWLVYVPVIEISRILQSL